MFISSERCSTPEERLVVGILMAALWDMLLPEHPTQTDIAERDASIAFFTRRGDRYARHRNALCSLLGINGDTMAERVRLILDGQAPFPARTLEPTPTVLRWHTKKTDELRSYWKSLQTPEKEAA